MDPFLVTYRTQNHYEQSVRSAVFELLIVPVSDTTQEVTQVSFRHNLSGKGYFSTNSFGFQTWRLRTEDFFQDFQLEMTCQVHPRPINPFAVSTLSVEEQAAILQDTAWQIANSIYLRPTLFTTLPGAQALFPRDPQQSVFDYLVALNQFVHTKMTYELGVTHIHTTAGEAWQGQEGVCQDYAHIFLAIARANGLPARYVSGYLDQGQGFTGSAAMHAWAEVQLPNGIWVGLDPTNQLLADGHYLKVAHGCDYADCSPLRGFLRPAVPNQSTYEVQVKAAIQA